MASFFRNAEEVLFMDYLSNGSTITVNTESGKTELHD